MSKVTAGAMRAARRMHDTFLVGGNSDASIRHAANVIDEETGVDDLLAACQAIWNQWRGNECVNNPDWDGYATMQMVRAAISKATT